MSASSMPASQCCTMSTPRPWGLCRKMAPSPPLASPGACPTAPEAAAAASDGVTAAPPTPPMAAAGTSPAGALSSLSASMSCRRQRGGVLRATAGWMLARHLMWVCQARSTVGLRRCRLCISCIWQQVGMVQVRAAGCPMNHARLSMSCRRRRVGVLGPSSRGARHMMQAAPDHDKVAGRTSGSQAWHPQSCHGWWHQQLDRRAVQSPAVLCMPGRKSLWSVKQCWAGGLPERQEQTHPWKAPLSVGPRCHGGSPAQPRCSSGPPACRHSAVSDLWPPRDHITKQA